MAAKAGRTRVVIEKIAPEVDAGRFPCKRIVGDRVVVQADIFADGHDELRCLLLFGKEGEKPWPGRVAMQPLGNDRWRGEFSVTEPGIFCYAIRAWVDPFLTWRRDLDKWVQAAQDVSNEMVRGGRLVEKAARQAAGDHARQLRQWAKTLLGRDELQTRLGLARDEELARLMALYPDLRCSTLLDPPRTVLVDPQRARFGAWYEMFPRSCTTVPGRHGTFKDCEERLEYLAHMGFDILYLPPIHPLGTTFRKGKNNSMDPAPEDPGSPWGIGSVEGGHKAVHPQLGTLEDFRRLLEKAGQRGIDIALDIALQCSPDHPYVQKHPHWFRQQPDGSIRHAENPPKKYQDIYPFDFDAEKNWEMWQELKSIFLFWIDQGVRIFRVDNPHTKPFSFWEWLISDVKKHYPEVIFLSEAFTRPKVMYRLAKLGFSQSYTYFAWRNSKEELTRYFTELTQTAVGEFFRANLWPNTPDILTAYLQHGGRPAFMIRLVLAATLGASYGIYGPAFELGVNQPFASGSEEYFHSEKYEIKCWDLDQPNSLKEFIARVNHIRRGNPALHSDHNLRFHSVDNPQLICFSKHSDDLRNVVLMVVNLDPHQTQAGWVEFSLQDVGLELGPEYLVRDLLGAAEYTWQGGRNFVELHPENTPAHIFCLGGFEPAEGTSPSRPQAG